MIKQVMMLILCVLALSACDSNSSGVTVNNGTTGESYIPINLTEISETTTGMVISGAIDHNTGEVDAFWIRADRGYDAFRNIEVETRNGYLLRLTHNVALTEGTHPITKTLDAESIVGNEVAGGLLYLWSPDEAKQFTQNPQGTLTIKWVNQKVLGTFSLTVENIEGEQVTIDGRFFTEESASAVR